MAEPTLGKFLHRLRQSMAAEALASHSDRDLLDKFPAKRDDAAFRAMLDRHWPMVYRVCRRALSSAGDSPA